MSSLLSLRDPDCNAIRATLCVAIALLCGCVQEMADQPRVEVYEPAAFFEDQQGMRPPIEGTVARGQLPEDVAIETGKRDGELLDAIPVDVTEEFIRRGAERFGIFCDHCHGHAGYGDGTVVQRGFPAPPSYHIERLQQAPAGRIFEVITHGHGRMPAFGRRIEPRERWSIVAYVQALQLSQTARLDDLPDVDRQALQNVSAEQSSDGGQRDVEQPGLGFESRPNRRTEAENQDQRSSSEP